MSPIDELCLMLAGRREEFFVNDFGVNWRYYSDPHTATECMDGRLIVSGLTPAQAIAATLGDDDATSARKGDAGTCRRLPADNYGVTCIVRSHGYEMEFGYWRCSECGTNCFEGARYCMNCGRKVVDE